MELIVKRHPVDDCYLEFYLDGGSDRDDWYLWTVHEDNMDGLGAEDFVKEIKKAVNNGKEVRVIMFTWDQLMEHDDEIRSGY